MQLTKLIFPKTHLFVFLNAHLFVLWIMDAPIRKIGAGILLPAPIFRSARHYRTTAPACRSNCACKLFITRSMALSVNVWLLSSNTKLNA